MRDRFLPRYSFSLLVLSRYTDAFVHFRAEKNGTCVKRESMCKVEIEKDRDQLFCAMSRSTMYMIDSLTLKPVFDEVGTYAMQPFSCTT